MRYYSIAIDGQTAYTSLAANGWANPGALNIELDISVSAADNPLNGSFVRCWGIGLQAISQANNLAGKKIVISAGMSAGLPLANPSQQGVIAQGLIYQAFGNWVGVDQTLDFVLTSGGEAPTSGSPNPTTPSKNLVLDWRKGQPLSQPLKTALQRAYPNFSQSINVDQSIVATQDQTGYHANIEQLAYFVRRESQRIKGDPKYPGVSIVLQNGAFNVFDGSTKTTGPTINYTDLIGQPTWLEAYKIQIRTVMRGDCRPGQIITLPKTLVTQTQASATPGGPQTSLSFQGSFTVTSIRHVGNFRQPDANSWCTIIDAALNQ